MADKVFEMTPSKIGTARVSSRAILAPKESLTYQNCEELEAMIRDCLDQKKTEIIVDFKKVSFMDSEALELLLRIHNELKDCGGSLKLLGLDAVCLDILKVTRLSHVFRIYEDIHKATKDMI
ncbi:MAG: STAS domain-containing protein [Desulfobacterales bacterium]